MQKTSFGRATPVPPAPVEQPPDPRRSKRLHTILKGKLSYRFGTFTADCTIRDKSEHGAKIKAPAGLMIPDGVFLVDLLNRVAYKSKVAWRKADGHVGLSFLETHDLSDPDTEELKLLTLFCIEHNLPGKRLRLR